MQYPDTGTRSGYHKRAEAEGGWPIIYITGDCHGEYTRFSRVHFPEQKEMTKDDYVIICGDFGYWDDSGEQRYWRKWLTEKSFTLLWVDGNHENYDMLKRIPAVSWKGGKAQFITPSIIRFMRGQVYDIGGVRFFTFGGAASHDIDGGILEPDDPDFKRKKKELDRGWKPYRVNHVSWWKEEMPSREEYDEGLGNLARAGRKVDFIVSHCAPAHVQDIVTDGLYKHDNLTLYLESQSQTVSFEKWFFGHYHDNRNVLDKYVMLYEQIIRIV